MGSEEEFSPCVGLCQMGLDSRHCLGCARTMEEIENWQIMSVLEKKNVLDLLQNRGSQIKPETK